MKILIVDDEELTREGIISSIPWEDLKIQEILSADDGHMGLHMARKHRPDIILSDVRMPRMDGLDMVKKIYDFLPESSIIFMSGYSDREYLKTAIKLRAVSYVEKPIEIPELKEALLQALKNIEQQKRAKRSEQFHTLEKTSQLALHITLPPNQRNLINSEKWQDLHLDLKPATLFTTYIIKCIRSISDMAAMDIKDIHHQLDIYLDEFHLRQIHVQKYDQYFIYHIFGNIHYNQKVLLQIGEFLKTKFEPVTEFFMAIGETVINIEKVYQSYNSAVFLLQSSFFHARNIILTTDQPEPKNIPVFTDPTSLFEAALLSKDKERILDVEKKIFLSFSNNSGLLPTHIKDAYYKLFMTIENTYKKLQLNSFNHFHNTESILENIEKCHNLIELNELLGDKINRFLKITENNSPENPTILAIKGFIHKNYSSDNLSVKSISDHVYMSSSYVCTLFKNETGLTLNQYITDFRIEQAKRLLADPNFKITDVSSKAGYKDGNYFAKIFKKQVGLSPSKYREKMLT